MKKNFILLVLAFSITFSSIGQIAQPPALSKSVNSTILQQVLNDFDRRIPLVLFVPGFFFIGSIQVSNNTLFNESDFYEETEMPASSDFYQQIVSDAASSNLLPYIPKDSVMKVRIMDENTLIFEMVFKHEKDTMFFNLTDGTQDKTKSIGYFADKVITTSYNDKRKMISFSSRLYGDTLRKSALRNNDRRTITNIDYTNGLPTRVSYYKINMDTKEERLKNSERFFYNIKNQPSVKQYLNRRGKIKRTINYYYNGDTLIQYVVNQGPSVLLTVTNNYSANDNSLLRTYYGNNPNYTKVHYFKESNNLNVEIEKSAKTDKIRYILRSDVNHRLSELEHMLITPDPITIETKKRWVFNYNTMGNLSSIKVIDKKGTIVKNILLEYSFMKP